MKQPSLLRILISVTILSATFAHAAANSQSEQSPPQPANWWIFDRQHVRQTITDQAGKLNASMEISAAFTPDAPYALTLGENSAIIDVPDADADDLPKRYITVTAWVSPDKPIEWGGIIGYFQDNGNYEKGWLLGYRRDQFSFAISTAGTLTYLKAKSKFQKGRWYHVAGVYDGAVMKIYVNGKLENSSTDQSGDIDYPPKAPYTIGAYKDDNELYRYEGKIQEIKVFRQTLTDDEVLNEYRRMEALTVTELDFSRTPCLQYDSPDSAVVTWRTNDPVSVILEYGVAGSMDKQIAVNNPQLNHRITIKDLKPKTVYSYRIKTYTDSAGAVSDVFEFDTTFNYSVAPIVGNSPFPDNATSMQYQDAAKHILSETGITKGYCLLYGSVTGQLAYETAKLSDLIIICVDEDPQRIAALRRLFSQAGVYGTRITARHVDSLGQLPITDNFANLIVSEHILTDGQCSGSAKEIYRVLRPGGGTACLGQLDGPDARRTLTAVKTWLKAPPQDYAVTEIKGSAFIKITRSVLAGAGAWTHQYGKPDNSSNSGDTLGGVTAADNMQVQWIGRPGADFGIDRNPRMPAPLSVNGRLFHQGLNRMIAVDAYNGAILWSAEIPHLRRVNIPRDAGNWCADNDNLYIAIQNSCWAFNAADGQINSVYQLPGLDQRQTHDWSYIARSDNLLYGSSVKKDSVYTDFWGKNSWYDGKSGAGTEKICSDKLFAYSISDGKLIWEYENGFIINTTIAAGDGKIYFVKSQNPELKKLDTGRIGSAKLWEDQYLVALDALTGKTLWEKAIDVVDGIVVFYLVYANNTVMISSSAAGNYHLYAYNAANGQPNWDVSHKWPSDNHSGHMQHPVVVNRNVYLEPRGYNIKTGKLVTDKMGRREGCATYAAVAGALIYRGKARRIAMWDVKTEKTSSWFNLRPSCWLSVIPAGGMILSPEGGGGCSCGNWLETSLGFAPKQN